MADQIDIRIREYAGVEGNRLLGFSAHTVGERRLGMFFCFISVSSVSVSCQDSRTDPESTHTAC